MPHPRMVEFIGGLMTGLLGLALSFYLMKPAESVLDYSDLFTIPTLAAVLVAVGAYVHAIRRKSWGAVLVWVGGMFLVMQLSFMLLGHHRVLMFLGWLGVFLFLPGIAAVFTTVASLLNRRKAEKSQNA